MGIYRSISDTITTVCKPIISAANTADESLSMATTYVENRAAKFKREDKRNCLMSEAESALEHKRKLQDDEELAALYAELEKEFYS